MHAGSTAQRQCSHSCIPSPVAGYLTCQASCPLSKLHVLQSALHSAVCSSRQDLRLHGLCCMDDDMGQGYRKARRLHAQQRQVQVSEALRVLCALLHACLLSVT